MVGKSASEILSTIADEASVEGSRIRTLFKEIASHPFKVIASVIMAPILIIKIALHVKNPIRRIIAVVGLLIAILFTYAAGTYLGSAAAFFFLGGTLGWFSAFGFLIGTLTSVYFTVIFTLILFNLISFVFLKINSEEVVDYLDGISD